MTSSSEVDERPLREIYLPALKKLDKRSFAYYNVDIADWYMETGSLLTR